jgi:hypothetical protein
MYNGKDYINKWLNKEKLKENIDYRTMGEVVKKEVFFESE